MLSERMPTFRYTLTRGNETRTTSLRKSNPQGWLAGAVRATFPEVAARRAGDGAACGSRRRAARRGKGTPSSSMILMTS